MKLNTLRPRRLRLNSAVRDMVRENSLSVKDLIYPIFVVAGENVKEEIPSMPDVYHLSVDNAVKVAKEVYELGIPAIEVFGLPEYKDEIGSSAWDLNSPVQRAMRAIKEAVASGKIGKQQIIKVTSRDPEAPPIEYVKVSGGIFLDMTIHDFDMVRYLSGSEVTEVFAVGSVTVDPAIGEAGDIDTAVITLKLANGATAVIDNCRKAVYGYDQRAEVFGTKGAIAISNDSNSNAVFSGEEGVVAEKPMYFFLERYMMAYAHEVKSFVDAIENDTETEVNANDGLQPVLIGLAAKKSVQEGRPVTIKEIADEYNL